MKFTNKRKCAKSLLMVNKIKDKALKIRANTTQGTTKFKEGLALFRLWIKRRKHHYESQYLV
jgi:hypothetical protein